MNDCRALHHHLISSRADPARVSRFSNLTLLRAAHCARARVWPSLPGNLKRTNERFSKSSKTTKMFSFILIITFIALWCLAAVLDAAVTAVMKTYLEAVRLHFGSICAEDKWWLKTAQRTTDEESSHSEAEEDEGTGGDISLSPRDENENGMEIPSDGKLLDNEEDVTKESQVLEERNEAILKFGKEDSTEDAMQGTCQNLEEERRKILEKERMIVERRKVRRQQCQQPGLSVAAEEQQQPRLLNAAEEKNDDSVIFCPRVKTGPSITEDLDAEEANCIAGTTHKLETKEISMTGPGRNPDQQNRVSIKMTIEKKVHRHIGTRTAFLQQVHGVTVMVPREEDSSETVEISGDQEGVLEVQTAISEMLDSFSCWRKERLEMSACKYERMCGHEGEILKRLRKDFDVRIYGPSEKIIYWLMPNDICKVKIHGHRDKVARVLEVIRRLTESEEEKMDVKSDPLEATTEKPKEQVGLKTPVPRKNNLEDCATEERKDEDLPTVIEESREVDLAKKEFSRTDCEPKEEWVTYTPLGEHHTPIDAQETKVPEEPCEQKDQGAILGTLENARVDDDVSTAQAMRKSSEAEK